jgi:hypothetical protein
VAVVAVVEIIPLEQVDLVEVEMVPMLLPLPVESEPQILVAVAVAVDELHLLTILMAAMAVLEL